MEPEIANQLNALGYENGEHGEDAAAVRRGASTWRSEMDDGFMLGDALDQVFDKVAPPPEAAAPLPTASEEEQDGVTVTDEGNDDDEKVFRKRRERFSHANRRK